MATSQETLDKWKEQGFEPTERAREADAWIDSRNPEDNPDEFTWVGSMGYVYTGPAAFYTTGSEHTAWLNSKLGNAPYETAYDVARVIDSHPKIPKASSGLFAPLDNYNPPPVGQVPEDVRPDNPPPLGQQVMAPIGQAQGNRPQWNNLNPMGGMLTGTPAMQLPVGLSRNQLINSLLGKRFG